MAKREATNIPAPVAETVPAPPASDNVEFQLLDQIVREGRVGRNEATRAWGKGLIAEFVKQVLDGQMTIAPDTEAMIHARIAQRSEERRVGKECRSRTSP